jgi:hypothetical protein
MIASMLSISLDRDQLDRIKSVAAREKPYAPRISLALAFRLLRITAQDLDTFSVLQEIDFLEGLRPVSRTKVQSQFTTPPLSLYPLWHKHFFTARHMVKNIGVRWNLDRTGNRDLQAMIEEVGKSYGDEPNDWIPQLAHRLTVGGYEDRIQHGLTGDWIVYAEHEGTKYYLDLASHQEGKDSQTLFEKLRSGCETEFPFVFNHVA